VLADSDDILSRSEVAAQQAVATDGLIELRSMLPPLNARALRSVGDGL
jgi:hypothetical protein